MTKQLEAQALFQIFRARKILNAYSNPYGTSSPEPQKTSLKVSPGPLKDALYKDPLNHRGSPDHLGPNQRNLQGSVPKPGISGSGLFT